MSNALMGATVCPYFVGMGFYTKDTSFDPATVWPGTKWQKLDGVFLLAAGSGHAVGEIGGEETHTLTIKEMPTHSHVQRKAVPNGVTIMVIPNESGSYSGDELGIGQINWYTNKALLTTLQEGESRPHNNMPPYAVRVYWERTE